MNERVTAFKELLIEYLDANKIQHKEFPSFNEAEQQETLDVFLIDHDIKLIFIDNPKYLVVIQKPYSESVVNLQCFTDRLSIAIEHIQMNLNS